MTTDASVHRPAGKVNDKNTFIAAILQCVSRVGEILYPVTNSLYDFISGNVRQVGESPNVSIG